MVDFGLLAVAFCDWGCTGRGYVVGGFDGQVEDVVFVGLGWAEGAEDDVGLEGGFGGEELVGEVFLGLL